MEGPGGCGVAPRARDPDRSQLGKGASSGRGDGFHTQGPPGGDFRVKVSKITGIRISKGTGTMGVVKLLMGVTDLSRIGGQAKARMGAAASPIQKVLVIPPRKSNASDA